LNCYSVDAELQAQPHDLSLAGIESKTAVIKPVTELSLPNTLKVCQWLVERQALA